MSETTSDKHVPFPLRLSQASIELPDSSSQRQVSITASLPSSEPHPVAFSIATRVPRSCMTKPSKGVLFPGESVVFEFCFPCLAIEERTNMLALKAAYVPDCTKDVEMARVKQALADKSKLLTAPIPVIYLDQKAETGPEDGSDGSAAAAVEKEEPKPEEEKVDSEPAEAEDSKPNEPEAVTEQADEIEKPKEEDKGVEDAELRQRNPDVEKTSEEPNKEVDKKPSDDVAARSWFQFTISCVFLAVFLLYCLFFRKPKK